MTKIITSVLDSDKNFYEYCINSQSEWAKGMGFSYEIYTGFHIRGMSPNWIRIAAFYEAMRNSNGGDRVIYLSPSVFVMGNGDPFAKEDGIHVFGDEKIFQLNYIQATVNRRNLDLLNFALYFSDIDDFPEKAFQLMFMVFPGSLSCSSRKEKMSYFGVDPFSQEFKAVTWKESSANIQRNGKDNRVDFFYKVGDFSIDLGINKYITKELSKEFKSLKAKIDNVRAESEEIYQDIRE